MLLEVLTLSAPVSFIISVLSILTLSTQNKLFGNENKANDHTQQFVFDEK